MKKFLLRRLYTSIITFFIVITFVFFVIRFTGDPLAELEDDPRITPEVLDKIRALFGLDKPIHIQYIDYLVNMFRGELGYSLHYKRPVIDVICSKLPYTLMLLIPSITLSNYIAYKLGVECGWRRRSTFDLIVSSIAFTIRSIPYFWLAILFLYIFSVQLRITPLFGAISPGKGGFSLSLDWIMDYLWHYILPFTVLTLRASLALIPYVRNALIEVLEEDYIVTAHAKGIPLKTVKYSHVARNAILPVITIMGLRYAFLIDGAILTETVFSYPGTGKVVFEAIINRDYWLLQGAVVILTLSVIIVNLIVDLIYALLDPRIRYR